MFSGRPKMKNRVDMGLDTLKVTFYAFPLEISQLREKTLKSNPNILELRGEGHGVKRMYAWGRVVPQTYKRGGGGKKKDNLERAYLLNDPEVEVDIL